MGVLEKLWIGKANVYKMTPSVNNVTKRTEFASTLIYSAIPCRVSYRRIPITQDVKNVSQVTQEIKLIASNKWNIPPGCKVVATQHGRTASYKSSGKPAIYSEHQEIILEMEDWA